MNCLNSSEFCPQPLRGFEQEFGVLQGTWRGEVASPWKQEEELPLGNPTLSLKVQGEATYFKIYNYFKIKSFINSFLLSNLFLYRLNFPQMFQPHC